MKKILLLGLCVLSVCTVVNAQPSEKSLKEAYKDYFMIGVAVNQRNISEAEQAALVKKEFCSITAENDMKPVSVHPEEGKWTWERADKIADFCCLDTCGKSLSLNPENFPASFPEFEVF